MPEDFLPIDIGDDLSFTAWRTDQIPLAPSRLIEKIRRGEVRLPHSLNELTCSQMVKKDYSLEEAARLKLPFAEAEAKAKARVFVKQHLQYEEIRDGDDLVYYGVAVRFIVTLKNVNSRFQVAAASIPNIAALAQLGFAEASAVFDVVGMTSPKIRAARPALAKLDVEGFGEIEKAFQKILVLMDDAETMFNFRVVHVP